MTTTSTTVGKNPIGKWSSPHNWQKILKCSTWVQPKKWQDELGSFPKANKSFNITLNQVYDHTTDAGEAEGYQFYEDLEDFLELTTKRCIFSS